ncbi:bifunctional glutamate N-acetyltransferase/amino-acid acetyltransferase ArgJ [Candidatus Methylopumilus universalis]|jgi:glutamate N-acetyltransferase/amino-acid N-acetyltransferase|uniref:Arginine biosynthesis bifunctional protein ArgJ n=1 Tax=Candidatus Methylopumilus universalis TaxID=2588536 RepID=A0AAX1EYC3_9PROT|nr:bifunctional glutamate N-acetyltransferase/amino-acid acetyltransferase ArgJ [Candidatus Methylopumilus universalis]QDC40763.1 bifunctional glutamate N-acetyltransferase/amino-acid acetyltransferase ArgJ [Candidatus Methylopumilus universalis]QDC42053.1 bifunctional glutamate N-acetyltransferase/amino-acid acetyltransferase ArgJ [Candidatus Methylopumilus universalis]QDC54440.1 bifunctional glutamate N-acetyltransferase/amino-acid acetyltransferase ArgJ [Candidatus Methylopumilus universalis]
MPVNLKPLTIDSISPIKGISLGTAKAHIKKPNRKDLLLVTIAEGSRVSGVFTQNAFCAAPVLLCKEHLKNESGIRALIINTGCANAGTGEDGISKAKETCQAVSELLSINSRQVLPFSTGVILESLPIDKIKNGLPDTVKNLDPAHWFDAAEAIMTTDIAPKGASRRIKIQDREIFISGVSKGSGMIHPNMATMLSFIATDASINQILLDKLLKEVTQQSFNCITVDGDTSTNDSFILIATGHAGNREIIEEDNDYEILKAAILEVAIELAQAIVRDGEGATKFITIQVESGLDNAECRKVGFAIAHSPLIKTAFFASDPNLGRILAAIGYAGIESLDISKIELYLGDFLVAEKGGRATSYTEHQGQEVMKHSEISMRILLNRGHAKATIWTCDFSYDYVKINADYRS